MPSEGLVALILGKSFPRVWASRKEPQHSLCPKMTLVCEAREWNRTPGRCIIHPLCALWSHGFSPQDWIDLVVAVCPPKEYDDEL